MNRALVFGIAIFFAVVGIALIGGESKVAMAGHSCDCSCSGDCGGCHGDCGGCHGRRGLFSRRNRGCCGCHGAPSCCGCHGAADHGCAGDHGCTGGGEVEAAPEAPEAPPAPQASAPRSIRSVSFRR